MEVTIKRNVQLTPEQIGFVAMWALHNRKRVILDIEDANELDALFGCMMWSSIKGYSAPEYPDKPSTWVSENWKWYIKEYHLDTDRYWQIGGKYLFYYHRKLLIGRCIEKGGCTLKFKLRFNRIVHIWDRHVLLEIN
jgi:hypothetical protein